MVETQSSRRAGEVPLGVFADGPLPPVRATLGYGERASPPITPPVLREESLAAAPTPYETLPEPEASEAPEPMEAELGEHDGARYEERARLGEGAMGEVLLVHDQAIDRSVALKRVHEGSPQADGAFLREARIMGALEHPNIVPVHDVGVGPDGRPYLVMKHVEGETLEVIIERLRAKDPAYVVRWSFEARIELFLGVLRALDYAHARGVLHRDIKPANVMVGPFGEVVLMDWGIAVRRGENDPARGRIVGTPYYMSPEQARGEAVDPRSDLYSATVMFHELVLLEHYLEPLDDAVEVLRAIGEHGWRWSMLDWMKVRPQPMPPMELYHFVHKGMMHAPAERFATAKDMIAELHRILDGRVRVQCPLTLTKRVARGAGRFVDRRPWIAFGVVAGTTITAGYGVVSALVQILG